MEGLAFEVLDCWFVVFGGLFPDFVVFHYVNVGSVFGIQVFHAWQGGFGLGRCFCFVGLLGFSGLG